MIKQCALKIKLLIVKHILQHPFKKIPVSVFFIRELIVINIHVYMQYGS